MIFDQSKGIPGIDVSHYQAVINYNAVKAAGAREDPRRNPRCNFLGRHARAHHGVDGQSPKQ